MRLWSIHPKYLDPQGLVALWREALLAQKVLMNQTKGYKNHPQLERFKNTGNPQSTIAAYLRLILNEAFERGYKFDASKIESRISNKRIAVTKGQLQHELNHLRRKLWKRNRRFHKNISALKAPTAHPIFYLFEGDIETWERV
jgi:hypothetical protein